MSGTMLAILVAVAGLAASGAWFGVIRRRKAETELGIQALANMKWRDCIGVVLEALHRDGFQRSSVSEAPGGATEVMLTRNGQDVLLEYKHGTAYHLTEANVREFVNSVSLNGARQGILVTLGTVGGDATHVAVTHNIQLIDGRNLWPKVRHFVLPSLFDGVRKLASARTRNGLWASALASVVLAGLVYAAVGDRTGPVEVTVADPEVAALRASESARGSDAAMLAQINATAKALEEVAKMTPQQLAARRADAAKQVSDLPRVGLAAWGGPRTLVVNIEREADDAKDNQLMDEVCRILVQNEEMRFTRVQLGAIGNSDQRVRWRLCE